jgi:hypothetical protein
MRVLFEHTILSSLLSNLLLVLSSPLKHPVLSPCSLRSEINKQEAYSRPQCVEVLWNC